MKSIDPEQFVWIFGSLQRISKHERKNYITCNIAGKKYVTGYFWRLYHDSISQKLEEGYLNYCTNSEKTKIDLGIGSMMYTFSFDGFNHSGTFLSDLKMVLQTNNYAINRPVLRIRWKDALKYLCVIGIHDSLFFENIYLYKLHITPPLFDREYYLFDTINQEKISLAFKNDTSNKITLENQEYTVDPKNSWIINNKGKIIDILMYKDQKIVNY
jgi:hypothetical protein